MRKITIAVLFVLMLSSCLGLNQFVVTPAGEEPAKATGRFMYFLPQTVLEVKMDLVKNIYLPGPYRQYAEKFLGISNYIKEEKTHWEIETTSLTDFSEPDPARFFSVNILKGFFREEQYFKLSSQGLVIDPMALNSVNTSISGNNLFEIPAVLELSMKKSHKEKVDTLFKTVITDTSFVKIPILRKQKEAKTLEQKAEEAANLIIKIRKRRLKLVTGEYAVFPEGVALRTALEELDKTEKEYIALFTGKIFTERYTCSYFVIPSGSDEKIVITRFSLQKGMLPLESIDGKEITIEFKAFVPRIQGITPGGENNKNLLYYRIPSTCAVKINEAERLLFDGRVSIFQAGTLLSLPVPER